MSLKIVFNIQCRDFIFMKQFSVRYMYAYYSTVCMGSFVAYIWIFQHLVMVQNCPLSDILYV